MWPSSPGFPWLLFIVEVYPKFIFKVSWEIWENVGVTKIFTQLTYIIINFVYNFYIKGTFNGGDGLVREYLFREHLKLCILTERRVFRPYALFDGESGTRGANTLITKNGIYVNLGSRAEIDVNPGDIFLLETPGGGGYGNSLENVHDQKSTKVLYSRFIEKGSLHQYDSIQQSA